MLGKIFIVYLFIPHNIIEAKRVTFYEDDNHSRLLLQHDFTNDSCVNLPTLLRDTAASLRTESCLLLYTGVDCSATSIKVDHIISKGEYNLFNVRHSISEHFRQRVKSFRMCTDEEGGAKINLDFYSSSSTSVAAFSYKDVCECINIPGLGANFKPLRRINNHHNCVNLYGSENCAGFPEKLQGGVSIASENLQEFTSTFNSISPCGNYTERCIHLSSIVTKFQFSPNVARQAAETTGNDISMAAKTKFINNGGATVSQEYTASKEIKETHETHRVDTISNSHSVSVEVGAIVEAEAGIPVIGKTKITASLTTAYNYQKESSSESGSKFVSEETVNYSVGQKIEILPCNMYDVSSYVRMTDNYITDYIVLQEITGKTRDGKQVEAKTLIQLLGQLEYVSTKDNFTIIGKGHGTLKSTFGLETVIDGEGQPIDGCQYVLSKKSR